MSLTLILLVLVVAKAEVNACFTATVPKDTPLSAVILSSTSVLIITDSEPASFAV